MKASINKVATTAKTIIPITTLLKPLPEELCEDVEVIDGALVSDVGVDVAVTDLEAIEEDNVELLEVLILFNDVVEELEALDVVEEDMEMEDVGSFMRTQIWPTTFKVAIKN
ncbi:predicted protein [Sclerotinia sclerotiorum 1980 UF-70]|uniref:Uncharacterized protein n=1 Tax=Sclerotinia sclerotiorum (strain ATCC 18683 / 1980 / Ss-1) TaxID=665079 RepID=A7E9H6_SCLS1|nr:predicted protein [Sclerotinia sclerotiorum 1980 UF-70]EDN97028.1 predicted protein [Sclerotinia sclerotiorum 1980 UF-70]